MKRGNWKSNKAYKRDAKRNSHHSRIAKGTNAKPLAMRVNEASIMAVALSMMRNMFNRRGRR